MPGAGTRSPLPDLVDQRVHLHDVTWQDYERLLELRGDDGGVRMTYLDGELEIMTPSLTHEQIKKRLARLLEAWSEEAGIDLEGAGSWTLRDEWKKRGLEPDECYFVGSRASEDERPHIAVEVIWTHGGIDRLAVYAGLGVQEVWWWQDGHLSFRALRRDGYDTIPRSELLPTLDPDLITRLMVMETTQAQAVRDLRAAMRR